MFTKQHYEWLAAFLRRERASLHYTSTGAAAGHDHDFNDGYSVAIDGITLRLARELRGPDFDEAKFLAACQIEPVYT